MFVSRCNINFIFLTQGHCINSCIILSCSLEDIKAIYTQPQTADLIYLLLSQLLIQQLCSCTRYQLTQSFSYRRISDRYEAQRTTLVLPSPLLVKLLLRSLICFFPLNSRNLI